MWSMLKPLFDSRGLADPPLPKDVTREAASIIQHGENNVNPSLHTFLRVVHARLENTKNMLPAHVDVSRVSCRVAQLNIRQADGGRLVLKADIQNTADFYLLKLCQPESISNINRLRACDTGAVPSMRDSCVCALSSQVSLVPIERRLR